MFPKIKNLVVALVGNTEKELFLSSCILKLLMFFVKKVLALPYPKIDFYVKNVTRGHIFHIGLMEDVKKATSELISILKTYNNNN